MDNCRKELNDLAKRVEFLEQQICSDGKEIRIVKRDGKTILADRRVCIIINEDGSLSAETYASERKCKRKLLQFIKKELHL